MKALLKRDTVKMICDVMSQSFQVIFLYFGAYFSCYNWRMCIMCSISTHGCCQF